MLSSHRNGNCVSFVRRSSLSCLRALDLVRSAAAAATAAAAASGAVGLDITVCDHFCFKSASPRGAARGGGGGTENPASTLASASGLHIKHQHWRFQEVVALLLYTIARGEYFSI